MCLDKDDELKNEEEGPQGGTEEGALVPVDPSIAPTRAVMDTRGVFLEAGTVGPDAERGGVGV